MSSKKICSRSLISIMPVFAAWIFLGCQDVSKNRADTGNVLYDLTRTSDGITISVAFQGEKDGSTEVLMGGKWADEQSPHNRFQNIKIEGGTFKNNGSTLTIDHQPSTDIVLSYDLKIADQREAAVDPTYFFAPVLTDNYIHLIGYTSLAVPKLEGDMTVSYIGDWSGNDDSTILRSRLLKPGRPVSSKGVQSGFLMFGAFELSESQDGRVQIATAPGVSVSSENILQEVAPLLNAMSELWDDEPLDYSVTLLPFTTERGTVLAGTAFPGGFSAALTPDIKTSDIQRFLAHETAHEIVPLRLGQPEFDSTDREGEGYWISEGFAEFFSREAQILAGTLDKDALIERVNDDLRELYQSPTRNALNVQVGTDFWTNRDIERLPYLRGSLLAHKWDAIIRQRSLGDAGMMDVLRDLGEKATNSESNIVLSVDAVLRTLENRGANTAREDYESVIINGEDFLPPPNMLGACYDVRLVNEGTYDVGFDANATLSNGIVSGVATDSAAYKAGLRNGLKFLEKVSGGGGDTSAPLVLRLQGEDDPFELSYLPISSPFTSVPQFFRKAKCKH